jgi:hypothetical protein
MSQYKVDLQGMQHWARGIMVHRPADFTVGADYMRRWWVIPRNDFANVYLHEFRASDDDRAMHDHPWASTSVLLFGQYIEHTPDGSFTRLAGDVSTRAADQLHRIELLTDPETGEPLPAISLFFTGPHAREWGFDCQHGWVHWRDFVDGGNSGAVGRGCGEHDDRAPVSWPGRDIPAGEVRA